MEAGLFIGEADGWFDEAGTELDSLWPGIARKVMTFRIESGEIGFLQTDERALNIARGILADAWRWSDELATGESFQSRAHAILVPRSKEMKFFSMRGPNWLFFHDPQNELLEVLDRGTEKTEVISTYKHKILQTLRGIARLDRPSLYEAIAELLPHCSFISRWTGEYIFFFVKDYDALETNLRKLCEENGVDLNIVVLGIDVLPEW